MACEYVRQQYGVPAEIGRRLTFYGKQGVIVADRGNYIGVNFDGEPAHKVSNVHPTDNVQYGEMGALPKKNCMTRSQKRYATYLEVAECYDSFAHYIGVNK